MGTTSEAVRMNVHQSRLNYPTPRVPGSAWRATLGQWITTQYLPISVQLSTTYPYSLGCSPTSASMSDAETPIILAWKKVLMLCSPLFVYLSAYPAANDLIKARRHAAAVSRRDSWESLGLDSPRTPIFSTLIHNLQGSTP